MALNKWIGMGRITAPIELKNTPNGVSVATFTVAIDRDFGDKQTDFINIVAWRQTAEFASKYFTKGSMICVEGSIQVRSYTTQSGEKRYATEVVADRVHFTGEKKDASTQPKFASMEEDNGYEEIEDADLPFDFGVTVLP